MRTRMFWGGLAVLVIALGGLFLFRTLPGQPAGPMEAYEKLVAALLAGDEAGIREVTTAKGFESVRDGARGYIDPIPTFGKVLARMRPFIRKNGWSQPDANHAFAGVSWHGGSGKHTDELEMVKTSSGWKLAAYRRVWDR